MSELKRSLVVLLLVLLLDTTIGAVQLKQTSRFSKYIGIEKTLFVYNTTAYDDWSDWGKCSTTDNCIQTRYRSCLDSSYNLASDDYKKNPGCNTKFIIERRICEGDGLEKCQEQMKAKKEKMKQVLEDCGTKQEVKRKVVGGSDAESNTAWPWNVGLTVSKKGLFESIRPQCGGTLITPRHVITAAHCVETILSFVNSNSRRMKRGKWITMSEVDKDAKFKVTVNDYDLNEDDIDEMTMGVEAIRYHPKYSSASVNNDFAILRLEKAFPADKIRVACLPRTKKVLPLNSTCYAVGWGYHQSKEVSEDLDNPVIFESLFDNLISLLQRDREFDIDLYPLHRRKAAKDDLDVRRQSDKLLQAKIPLRDLSVCKKVFRRLSPASHICAGKPGVDTCEGDSGGGLYCQDEQLSNKWVLYGITSYGSEAGCGIYSSIYASVATNGEWLQEILLNEELDGDSSPTDNEDVTKE